MDTRHSARLFSLGVILALCGVLASVGHGAFAREPGLERPAAVEPIADPGPSPRRLVVAQNLATDPAVARLEVRLSELERDLRASTGQVEDLSHQVRQLSARLEKLSADVDYRLAQPGGVGVGSSVAAAPGQPVPPAPRETVSPGPRSPDPAPGPAPLAGPVAGEGPTVLGRLPESEVAATAPRPNPTAPPPSPTEPAPPTASPPQTQTAAVPSTASPREQYANGFGLLRTANYDRAEAAFKAFLSNNPDDPLADNARYWLGETYYARGQYAPAAEAFLDAYQRNKTGPKAPDSLLKLGMSLGNLDKVREACATYHELETALPDAPVSIKTTAQKERQALGCR